jgi:arginine decarboxylase
VGTHKHRLVSFEAALRDAQIEIYNLIYVSSIFPPGCEIVNPEEGIKELKPGQVVPCVMARIDTNEPSRRITAAVGLAQPQNTQRYGYISEHHTYGEDLDFAKEYAEDLAATMLATTLGIDFEPDDAWNERKQVFEASGQIFKTDAWGISAEGNERGEWTTVIATGVFVM